MLIAAFMLLSAIAGFSQEPSRIQQLRLKLESLSVDIPGLSEKADITVNRVKLTDFLRAIANAHKINLNINPDLSSIVITNNTSDASVTDVLLFVCKEYNLTIDFTGNIMSVKRLKKTKKVPAPRIIPVDYDKDTGLFSIELQKDTLQVAFKTITDKTGYNLVYAPGIGNTLLTAYIKNMPFESALDKIAFANDLKFTKTRDNYYLFEKNEIFEPVSNSDKKDKKKHRPRKRRSRAGFFFSVTDTLSKSIEVDIDNVPIGNIVQDIGDALNLNMYTSHPLDEAGTASVKAKNISFDLLLDKLFENTEFSYKKVDNIYYFGKKEQASVRSSVVIPLQYRSIEIMSGQSGMRKAGRINNQNNTNYYSTNNNNQNASSFGRQNTNAGRRNTFDPYKSKSEAFINIIPQEIVRNLDIKTDSELNSFIVSGPERDIEKFKDFIRKIDKPVPVISIEVMILEVNKTAKLDTGISFGLGEDSAQTAGQTYPDANITLGSSTVNAILQTVNGFGSVNLGQVLPNFYAHIKALESNGNIKIRSTPRLSTLNGHRANLSIGETTYYVVTNQNFYGSQIPQTSEVKNYQPIDAELAIGIKPIVSGDGQITLDISVVQSSFNGKKVDENAPPGINSREFTSIVRVKDEDLIVLGGLEEKIKNDSGSGVPLLARIPIIKWLFSKRVREDTKKKLVVLIKPTVIY